jgi:hypothetical protein
VSEFYSKQKKISGAQILSITEIKQINLFVIRELMNQWQAETQKLKSPYFNYEAEAVVESLNAFHNTLSNHIAIAKADFFPLLKKAVTQTLYLLLSPYDFYAETLDTQGKSSLSISDLKNHIKYVKINRAPLERLLEKLEEKKATAITGNESFALLDTILEEVSFAPEEIDTYIAKFSSVFPLTVERLYESKAIPARPVINPVINEGRKPLPMPEIIQTALPLQKEHKVVEAPTKTGRIKDKLTINQKFMFTKMLFHGDFEIFTEAIDRLDMLDSLAQAKTYLVKTYPEWDQESEEYAEFISLIERKFLN